MENNTEPSTWDWGQGGEVGKPREERTQVWRGGLQRARSRGKGTEGRPLVCQVRTIGILSTAGLVECGGAVHEVINIGIDGLAYGILFSCVPGCPISS